MHFAESAQGTELVALLPGDQTAIRALCVAAAQETQGAQIVDVAEAAPEKMSKWFENQLRKLNRAIL